MKLGLVVGHSKKKTGAFNKTLGIREYSLNEELALALAEECSKRGIDNEVIYRLNGYSQLPGDINKTGVSHCICIHHNSSSNAGVNGTETLYYKFSKTSDVFAKFINDAMVQALGFRDRGLLPRTQGDNGGHVLKNTSMPCILIEPYFMSMPEAVINRDYQKLAVSMIDGFERYIDG